MNVCDSDTKDISQETKEESSQKPITPRQLLKDITTVKIKTFDNFCLEIEQVSYANISDDGFDILIELSASQPINTKRLIELKANCYDKEGNLIFMDSVLLDPNTFGGYDTLSITCFEVGLYKEIGKIMLYAALN